MKRRLKRYLLTGGAGGAGLSITATTTGDGQTVTLQRITPTGGNVTVKWGDGGVSTILNGNTGTTTHVYTSAGTYSIEITNPAILTYIDLRDTKLTFNSSTLANCAALAVLYISIGGIFNSANLVGLPITSLTVALNVAGTYTFNSAHIEAMALTSLFLSIGAAGTYTFNSAHIEAMALTSLNVTFSTAGTYTFNSAHIAAMALTSLTVNISVAGTYTLNSAHIAAMALTYLQIGLIFAGTYVFDCAHIAAISTITYIMITLHATNTFDLAQADWDGFPACGTIRVEASLTQTEVDNLLLGLYAGFATKAVASGTVDLLGGGNAAPSGVLQAQCPPTTGYEAAYELVNDSCGVSTKHWSSVTTA